MEECTINAALSGDYGMALQAFTINPLIQKGGESKQVLNELLVAHEKYLPQFKEKIVELKNQGVETKDPVVADLMKNGY
jgi:6-phospho-beta-glucosidase